MAQTPLRQKLALLIFGVSFTIILLEISLRLGGAVVLFLQERHNHLSFSGEYQILCLGESTTALGGEDAYPSQLEKILNEQGEGRRFTVINKGIVGTTTDYILSHVDQNLDKYKPQLVVVMMGINDRFHYNLFRGPQWLWQFKLYVQSFRVYKLVKLISEHLTHHTNEIKLATLDEESFQSRHNYQQTEDFLKHLIGGFLQALEKHMQAAQMYKQSNRLSEAQQEYQFAKDAAIGAGSACADLGHRYRQKGLLHEAQDFLEKAIQLDPNSSDIYEQWGDLYLAQEKPQDAIRAFQQALVLDSKNEECLVGLARAYHLTQAQEAIFVYSKYLNLHPQDYWGYIELAQWLKEKKLYPQAMATLSKAMEIDPNLDRASVDFGQILDEQGQDQREEVFYLKMITLNPRSSRLCQALGQLYHKQGKEDLARQYFFKAEQGGLSEYRFETLENYDNLLNKISNRGLSVVVMQYPLRSIDPLKNHLGNRKNVIFVENKQNFKEALQSGDYAHYFKDTFADDFGHCTRYGNELIARNLAEQIMRLIKAHADRI